MVARRTAAEKTKLVVQLKRAYDPPSAGDGSRVLVDRLWPRGVTKEKLKIDAWMRDLGPSDALRKWFGHDPARWEGFRGRYMRELARKKALLEELVAHARRGKLTLVYSAHDPVHNQAVVIREVLGRDRSAWRPLHDPQ
jgi:uncharacterized protein YeaO (DUF488 family)